MTLLGNLKGSAHVFPETSFYNGVIGQSLRLSVGSDYKLDRQMVTPTSVTGTICTASWWMKKSAHGTIQSFIQCRDNQASGNYAAYWSYDTSFGSTGDHHAFRNETDSLHVGTDTSVVPYRDPSSWYHVVIRYDSTQGTAADRIRIYKNGTLQNSTFTTTTYPSQNHVDTFWNNAGEHLILFGNGEDSGDSFDGYIAEFNWVDGQSLAPETFGELKNGVWIPKKITLSTSDYGLNGSRYTFADSSDIGKDTSGVGNDLDRVSNLSASDVVPDSPENNFATLNSLTAPGGSLEYLEGNLKITRGSVDAYSLAMSTLAVKTGKWYAELRPQGTITSNNHMVGVCITNVKDQSSGDPYLENGQINYVAVGNGHVDDGGSISASTFSGSTSFGAGDIIGVALDLDSGTRTVKFYKNNSLVNTSSYGNLSSEFDDEHIGFMSILFGTNTCMWNFGQDSTFAGQISAGGNTDGNGIGDFKYAPPSGYLALCSANLPEPTISPNSLTQADDHFNTVLYTGSGSTQSITGVGFQSDWSWFKRRDASVNHALYDSTRGGTNALRSNTDGAESQFGDAVVTFQSDGFQIAGTNVSGINGSSDSMVAWNWKANGGTTSSNTDGSITSTVQANTDAGFSVITYTGGGSAGDTIGHGLNSAPEQVWFKRRGATGNWMNYVKAMGNDGYINLDRTNGKDTGGSPVNSTDPSSSVITLGSFQSLNGNTNTYVAYAFHSVEGYSKMGSYTGNGNADGAFVFTGFRPAWILFKATNATQNWFIFDSVRDTFNVAKRRQVVNTSSAESDTVDAVDFLSNGFKLRTNNNAFNGSYNYIYMAFAEAPFKYANGR